jgi:hypothetical protein
LEDSTSGRIDADAREEMAMSDPRWPGDGPEQDPNRQDADPTRRVDAPGQHDPDPTRQLPAQPAGHQPNEPWEAEVPARTAGAATHGSSTADDPHDPYAGPVEPGSSSRGKQVAIGVISGLVGFILAFILIAIFTGGDEATDDPGAAASQERIDALEAELADRDLQIEELEARLAEAEAAAGESDADIEAQRQALDERATALDQRAGALDEREAALDEREAAIAEREQEADAEPAPSEPDPEPDDNGGLTPPEFDEEQVENIVNRVLERLRDLFN